MSQTPPWWFGAEELARQLGAEPEDVRCAVDTGKRLFGYVIERRMRVGSSVKNPKYEYRPIQPTSKPVAQRADAMDGWVTSGALARRLGVDRASVTSAYRDGHLLKGQKLERRDKTDLDTGLHHSTKYLYRLVSDEGALAVKDSEAPSGQSNGQTAQPLPAQPPPEPRKKAPASAPKADKPERVDPKPTETISETHPPPDPFRALVWDIAAGWGTLNQIRARSVTLLRETFDPNVGGNE